MPREGWEEASWGTLAVLEYGKPLRNYRESSGPVRVYGSNGPIGWAGEVMQPGPGVIVGRKGAYRGVEYSPGPYWVIDTAYWLRPLRELDLRWAYYALLTQNINGQNSGSAIPSLSRADFSSLRALVPPPGEQREIAKLLGALDAKIAATRSAVGAAEAYISGVIREAEQAGDWVQRPLTNLARFVNGGAYTKEATGTGRIVVRIRELNSGVTESTVFSEIDVPADQEATAGSILFSWSGSLGVYRWRGPSAIVNQHIFKVIPTDIPAWLVYHRLVETLPEFQAIAKDKATTMGHIQRHHLDRAVVRVPRGATATELEGLLTPVWNTALSLEVEELELRAAKAALLPALISGHVRVRPETTA
jgi:type I restriction enzyme S subunit